MKRPQRFVLSFRRHHHYLEQRTFHALAQDRPKALRYIGPCLAHGKRAAIMQADGYRDKTAREIGT